ncbi:hypothetical protein DMENIID0001_004450 [Sergentomyia squamirostris]
MPAFRDFPGLLVTATPSAGRPSCILLLHMRIALETLNSILSYFLGNNLFQLSQITVSSHGFNQLADEYSDRGNELVLSRMSGTIMRLVNHVAFLSSWNYKRKSFPTLNDR